MNWSFEKLALAARAVEKLHEHAKQRFDRTTKAITEGTSDLAYNKITPEKARGMLAKNKKDMEDSSYLLSEIREEMIRLSEPAATRGNGEARPFASDR